MRSGPALTHRRLVVAGAIVAVGALGIAGIDRLADATQTRPDHQPPGTATEIVFEVETLGYRQDPALAATALWGTCSATVSSRLVGEVQPVGHGRFRAVVAPALGHHGRERVVGCLNDLTLDRVRSSVVHVERMERGPRSGALE
jgi:hypothetical protein